MLQLTLTTRLERVVVAENFYPNDCIKIFDNAVTTAICVVSLMGKTSVFQTDDTGSIPVLRFIIDDRLLFLVQTSFPSES